MSLAFLAKKSWHTTNISNQEKVWLKQQEQEREKKKLELLQKQMKEEREIEEMRQASGQARPKEKLTWMYSQPINLNTDDEYLMGKMKEPEKEDEELKKVVTNQGISQAFIEKQKEPARAWRDDMNKIRDDPLLAIKQAEKRQREKIMDNPLKIAQFKEELEKKRLAKEEKKAMKKAAKKAVKKEKKHGKGNRSDSSDGEKERRKSALDPSFIRGGTSSGRDWDTDKARERGEARSTNHDGRHRERSRERDRDRSADGKRDRGRNRDSSRERGQDREQSRERQGRWEDKKTRSEDASEDGRERKNRWDDAQEKRKEGGLSRSDGGGEQSRDDASARKRARSPADNDVSRESSRRAASDGDRGKQERGDQGTRVFSKSQAETKFGYGLWKGDNAEHQRDDATEKKEKKESSYDPRTAPKVQKKEEYSFTGRRGIIDNGAEAARKHHAARPKMTEEEQKAALAAMTNNAAKHDENRSDRIKLAEEAVAREQAKAKQETQGKDVDVEFQSKLNKETFMNSATSMAERLSQRKHYRERLGDE